MYINRQNIDAISTIKSFSEGKAQRRFESMADIFGTFGERPSGAARPPLALRRVFHVGSVPAQRGSEAPPWSPITKFKIKPFEMWQRLDKQQQQKNPKNHLGCNFSHQSQDCGGGVEVGLSGSVMVLELLSVVLWQKTPRSNRWYKTYSFVVQINTCTCENLQHWH